MEKIKLSLNAEGRVLRPQLQFRCSMDRLCVCVRFFYVYHKATPLKVRESVVNPCHTGLEWA
jgi:hypothetical protein